MARVLEGKGVNRKAAEDRNRILGEIDKMKSRYKDPEFSAEISQLTYQIRNSYPMEEGVSSGIADKIAGILNVYANSRDNYFKVFRNDDEVDLRQECAIQTNTEIFNEVKQEIEEVFGDTMVRYSIAPQNDGKRKLFKSKEDKEKEKKNKETLDKIQNFSDREYRVKFAYLEERMKRRKLENQKVMLGKLYEIAEDKAVNAENESESEKYADQCEYIQQKIAEADKDMITIDKNINRYKDQLEKISDLKKILQDNMKKTENGLVFTEEEEMEILNELDTLYMLGEERDKFSESLKGQSQFYKNVEKEAQKKQQSPTRARIEKLKQEKELAKLGNVGFNEESIRSASKEKQ